MPTPTSYSVTNLYKKIIDNEGIETSRRPMLLRTLSTLVFRSNGKNIEETFTDIGNDINNLSLNKADKSDLSTVATSGEYSDLLNNPTLGTAASKDVPTSGNANSSQIVLGNDSRLTNARTPIPHTHTKNEISDFPTLGTASTKNVATSGDASTSQVVMGNDSRLTDARPASDVSSWAKASSKPTYTKSEVGLGNVDNTSDATKKSNFTGSIASGNTGFVTGGDAYTALSAKLETSLNFLPT